MGSNPIRVTTLPITERDSVWIYELDLASTSVPERDAKRKGAPINLIMPSSQAIGTRRQKPRLCQVKNEVRNELGSEGD